jgi:proteasome assembly chaperone (PAC2) family protein
VAFDDGGRRRIDWPGNRFWAGEIPGQDRDLLVLEGIEPNLRWRTYGEQITGVAHELSVSMVVTLGALLTDIPHTRPTSVIGTADDAELITRLDLRPSGYDGPTGIVGALHESCRTAGLDSISLWGSVPSYVPGSTSPKAALALVERLGQLLDTTIPVTELEIATTAYERQLDELVQEDEESSTYVAELERVFDEQALHGTGSDLVDEVERFLRDR